MEFQNNTNGNNSSKKKSTNTRGIQLMNVDAPESPSTLSLGWWDNFLTLSISPTLDEAMRTDGKVFNYNIAANTALSPEKCHIMYKIYKTRILPALENNEEVIWGVPIGGNSLLCLGTKTFGKDKVRPYLAMHKNLAEGSMKPELSLKYIFREDSQMISGFDPDKGSYESHVDDIAELELFGRILEYAATELTMGAGHSVRASNRFYNDNLKETVNNIANKVGAETVGYSSNKRSYSGKSIFNGGQTTTASYDNSSTELATQDGLDDLPF